MAKIAEMKMRVSVESAIHDAIMAFSQSIHDDYGVQLLGVIVEWCDVSTVSEQKSRVVGVELDTRKMGGPENPESKGSP